MSSPPLHYLSLLFFLCVTSFMCCHLLQLRQVEESFLLLMLILESRQKDYIQLYMAIEAIHLSTIAIEIQYCHAPKRYNFKLSICFSFHIDPWRGTKFYIFDVSYHVCSFFTTHIRPLSQKMLAEGALNLDFEASKQRAHIP